MSSKYEQQADRALAQIEEARRALRRGDTTAAQRIVARVKAERREQRPTPAKPQRWVTLPGGATVLDNSGDLDR